MRSSGATEPAMRAYIDSDLLIRHLRGEAKAAALLRRLSAEAGTDLWIGALQRAEVVFFMRPREATATRAFLSRFKTEAVTQGVVDLGADLYRTWHPSHGIDVNDAILAATVATTGGKIYTQNLKHYPMPDVVVLKGW
jgi:predicted nucleic acid-binding protein